jgi:hypothetical protein
VRLGGIVLLSLSSSLSGDLVQSTYWGLAPGVCEYSCRNETTNFPDTVVLRKGLEGCEAAAPKAGPERGNHRLP